MTTQHEKAQLFTDLHQKGAPIILYNIWDAGSAQAVERAGAPALATGSWSVAAAHGYSDGENIPIDLLFTITERIVASSDLPVSVDFEGGYASEPAALRENIKGIIEAGAVGINFEDRIVGDSGLYDKDVQSDRLISLRDTADSYDIPFFINARTDIFLNEPDPSKHEDLIDEAIERANVYAVSGASGFFVPGLMEPRLIEKICQQVSLPVNIMMMPNMASISVLTSLGVARISYGAMPYRRAMKALKADYEAIE